MITTVQAMELGQVLGSLLGSVVQAQAESARATVDFVDSVGFEPVEAGERMRTVKVRYQKKDETGTPVDFEVEVPLLTLVNVPSLAVKRARLAFSYDVVTARSAAPTAPTGALPVTTKVAPATLKGFIRRHPAPTSRAPARTMTSIDLHVTLEQQEIPLGVERLFDLAEQGITERSVRAAPP